MSFTYDGSLPLATTWSGTVAGSVSRTYDNSFRITSRSVNGGNTISFTYDQDDLLTSAGSETLTNDSSNGLLTGTSLGVVTDSYAYNGFAEMADYEAQVSGMPVFGTVFERDKLGRITKKTETVNGVTHVFDYTYDTAGRLHEVFKDSVLQNTYTYDANGNRLNNGAVYDDQDRLVSTSTATYTYTANGELATKTEGGQTTTYNYDVVGNLISVTLSDGTLIEYVIDGRNRRVGKKVNGVLTKAWLYKDSLNPIAELDGAGNVVSRFVYGSRFNVPDFVIKSGVTYRIVSDHLGSPRQVINTSDGTVAQQLDYDEWGNVTVDTNPGFIPFGFAGGIYDQDTKLVRFGARDYDAEVGRWTGKDPVRFGGGDTNLFSYVVNDPVNAKDFTGLFPFTGFADAIVDFFEGATSYPRGIVRALLNVARHLGAFGKADQICAEKEAAQLNLIIEQLAKNKEFQNRVMEAAKDYLSKNKAKVVGRFGTQVATNIFLTGKFKTPGFVLGNSLVALAIYGDLRDALAKGNADPEGLARAILGGVTNK